MLENVFKFQYCIIIKCNIGSNLCHVGIDDFCNKNSQ